MKPTRRISPPGTYFITFVASGQCALLQPDRMARLLLETLYWYRRAGKFLLHGFVIMPDHVHVLLTPAETIERTVQLIQGGFSYRASHELGVRGEMWERGFTQHRIRDEQDFRTRLAYVHASPVRRGLCATAAEWRYSSAFQGAEVDAWSPRALPSAAKAVG